MNNLNTMRGSATVLEGLDRLPAGMKIPLLPSTRTDQRVTKDRTLFHAIWWAVHYILLRRQVFLGQRQRASSAADTPKHSLRSCGRT